MSRPSTAVHTFPILGRPDVVRVNRPATGKSSWRITFRDAEGTAEEWGGPGRVDQRRPGRAAAGTRSRTGVQARRDRRRARHRFPARGVAPSGTATTSHGSGHWPRRGSTGPCSTGGPGTEARGEEHGLAVDASLAAAPVRPVVPARAERLSHPRGRVARACDLGLHRGPLLRSRNHRGPQDGQSRTARSSGERGTAAVTRRVTGGRRGQGGRSDGTVGPRPRSSDG